MRTFMGRTSPALYAMPGSRVQIQFTSPVISIQCPCLPWVGRLSAARTWGAVPVKSSSISSPATCISRLMRISPRPTMSASM